MDETHLAGIEARCRAATPGPWDRERIESNVISDCYEYLDLDGDEPELPLLDHQNQQVWPWARRADMEFAYSARTDVPALLAEIRRLSDLLACTLEAGQRP